MDSVMLFNDSNQTFNQTTAVGLSVDSETRLLWQTAPFLILTAIIGNTISIIVWLRLPMTSTFVYFIALGVIDTGCIVFGLSRHWLKETFEFDLRTLHPIMCKGHTMLSYFFMHTSSWIIAAMCIDRCWINLFPHRKTTPSSAKIVISVLVCVLLAVDSHFFWTVKISARSSNSSSTNARNSLSFCSFDPAYHRGQTLWTYFDLVLQTLLPFLIMCISNFLLVRKLSQSTKSATMLHTRREREWRRISVTLIGVSLTFLFLTTPINVYVIYQAYEVNRYGVAQARQNENRITWFFLLFLMYLNNACNFILYSLLASRFRQTLISLLCKNNSNSQQTESGEHYTSCRNARNLTQLRDFSKMTQYSSVGQHSALLPASSASGASGASGAATANTATAATSQAAAAASLLAPPSQSLLALPKEHYQQSQKLLSSCSSNESIEQ